MENNILLYDENGNEIKENDSECLQPKYPLRLCVFYISNSLHSENDLQNIYKIIVLLIQFGANKNDALMYFNYLYGNINNIEKEKTKYHTIYNLLYN